jgi:hypothetical protein
MLVVHHVQSTVQGNWFSRRLGHQHKSVEELHHEKTIYAGAFVLSKMKGSSLCKKCKQDTPINLPCILKVPTDHPRLF